MNVRNLPRRLRIGLLLSLMAAGCGARDALSPRSAVYSTYVERSTVFEAEMDAVAPFAAPLIAHCNESVSVERIGSGHFLYGSDAASWRVRGCDSDLHFKLECDTPEDSGEHISSSNGPGYLCNAEAWPIVSREQNIDILSLEAALRDAESLPSTPACPSALAVRSVAHESRREHFDVERCGVVRRIEIACGGSPIVCMKVAGVEPQFRRAVSIAAEGFEWSYWASGGASFIHARGENQFDAAAGIGSDLTFRFLRYERFPSGIVPSFLDVAELRAGPWVAASSRGERGDVESGVVVSLGNPFHPKWGALSARSGIGYGAFEGERAIHGSFSLAWGLSWIAAQDEGLIPSGIVRFAGTYRPLFSSPGQEVLFGIELSPALFFPQRLRTPSPG
jgi:hypothetical protein